MDRLPNFQFDEKQSAAPQESMLLPSKQLQELIETNRTLHDVVLDLQKLLSDPSRSVAYPTSKLVATPTEISRPPSPTEAITSPRKSTKDDPEWVETTRVISLTAVSGSGKHREIRTFEEENNLARERHQDRRTREIMRLKSKVSYKCKSDVSFPSSFYQGEIESFARTRQYSSTDPHNWWHRLNHHRHDKQLAPGPHVDIGSTGLMRDELLDALFDFDSTWPEHLLHTLPLRELEHTYGYKLYRIKATPFRSEQPSNELIVEIGRYFKDLASTYTESRAVSEPWIATKQRFTLASLYRRCHARGVLEPVEGPTEKQVKVCLGRIWNVLQAFNHVAVLPQSLPTPASVYLDDFILDVLDRHYIRDGAPNSVVSTPNGDLHFLPKELCFKTLTELGGLKIVWTSLYTQHLRLVRSSKTLMVFWDVSIFGQSPLFAHWPLWLNKSGASALTGQNPNDYSVSSVTLLEELKRSYRIIFGNPDGRFLERFFRKHFSRSGDEAGILLQDFENLMLGPSNRTRVNISRTSARQALKYYLRAPIPKSIISLRPELDRKKHRGPKKGSNLQFYLRKPTAGKLVDLLKAGPPFPLDFWMHISYLLELSQSSGLSEMERYSAYPIYGERLRELKAYMDKQRPKNLRQLFKDRRDTVGYWAFWAVVFVGGASIILALISIAVSSAQTVASFKALSPLYQAQNQTQS